MRDTPTLKTLTKEQLESHDTFLFDADGCIWMDTTPLPGAVDFINELINKGKRVFIVTNNGTKTKAEIVKKCKDLGFGAVKEHNIVSSAVVMVNYLKRHPQFTSKNVYVIGTKPLANMIENVTGAKTFGVGPDTAPEDATLLTKVDTKRPVSAVVVGYDPNFSYLKMMKAANYLRDKSVGFFISNEDRSYPLPDVSVPGSACITASVRMACLPRQPLVFGKPSRLLASYLFEKHRIDPSKTIMFGDRLDTDMKFANENGFTSCLVLTGAHREADVQRARLEAKDPTMIPRFTYSFADHFDEESSSF